MTNKFELDKILNELRETAIERKTNGQEALKFDIRLQNVEILLSEYAIDNDIAVPLPEFLTSDELFLVESLLS